MLNILQEWARNKLHIQVLNFTLRMTVKTFFVHWRLICSLVTVFLFDVALATFSVTVKKYLTKATCG